MCENWAKALKLQDWTSQDTEHWRLDIFGPDTHTLNVGKLVSKYRLNILYIEKPKMFVCFLFLIRPQLWADLHKIWHVASLYTLRMVMGLATAARAYGLALRGPSILRCKWVGSFVGKFGTSGPSAVSVRIERCRREVKAPVSMWFINARATTMTSTPYRRPLLWLGWRRLRCRNLRPTALKFALWHHVRVLH